MRNALFVLLFALMTPTLIFADEAKPSRTERIVGGLLDFGSAVVKQRAEKRKAQEQAEPAEPTAQQGDSTMQKLGKSVGVLVQGITDPAYLAEQLGGVLKETTELTLRNYLDRYKEEGREYARDLANIITERIVNHDKVASVLDSVRMLCWGVIIYLSVISILIFAMLWRMKCANERVLAAVEELRRQIKNS